MKPTRKLKRKSLHGEHFHKDAETREQLDEQRIAAEGDTELHERVRQQADLCDAMVVLKAAREAAGISLRQLEDQTGIPRGNLSKLENGLRNPTLATLQRYAEAIGRKVTVVVD